VTFKAVLYTSKNWNSSDDGITYTCTSDSESEYKEIETIEIKYSPFIVLSENAEVFPEDWAIQNINDVDIQSAAKKCCSAFNLNQNVNTRQSIYLDGSINATVPYDELPMVRMVNTALPYNRCIKDWCDYGHLENIQEIVNSDTCYFLLFDHNLPKKFGENEFTDDNDKLAICAYRKSIDGQVARQRYSLVGVTKTLDNPNLIWRGQYSYDFTSFDESVKYYSSRPFTISITAQMGSKVDISYN
jgi:hypothetical protein